MQLIGAVVVFLGGACVGLLAGICVTLVRLARSLEEQHARALEAGEQHHRALRSQLQATTAAILDRVQLTAAGLAAQLQATAAEVRNDRRLAMQLPTVRVPGEAPNDEVPTPRSPTWIVRGRLPAPRSGSTRPSVPGSFPPRLRDEDATPASGWSLEQYRATLDQKTPGQPVGERP